MSFIDNIKNFFVPVDDEADETPVSTSPKKPEPDDDDDEQDERPTYTSRPSSSSPTSTTSSSASSSSYSSRSSSKSGASRANMGQQDEDRPNFVNISTTAQLQVVLVKPEVFTDAKQIADHLIAKKTVVLNLESATADNKRRIIDFLVGVAYANGGILKPVANLTYIITPYNVGFVGEDLVGELENNGVMI